MTYIAYGYDVEGEYRLLGWITVTGRNNELVAASLKGWKTRGRDVVLVDDAELMRQKGWENYTPEPYQMALL